MNEAPFASKANHVATQKASTPRSLHIARVMILLLLVNVGLSFVRTEWWKDAVFSAAGWLTAAILFAGYYVLLKESRGAPSVISGNENQ